MKSSNKVLTIAVVLLLLVNIGLIVFLLMGRNHHDAKRSGGRGGGAFDMIVKELDMNEQQKKEFGQLREDHFKMIRPLFDSIRAAKTAFFGLIKEPHVSDSTLSIYSQRITSLQTTANKLTFAHFQKVRSLFEGDQQKKFDEFVQKMMQRSGGPGGRRKDSTENER
jgi:periplasmic protein CpxP/Spy